MMARPSTRLAATGLAMVMATALVGPGHGASAGPAVDQPAGASGALVAADDTPLARAKKAYADGDVAGALAIWNELALQGDAEAQFALGAAYSAGEGVALDVQEAAKWYRLAGAQGNMHAQVGLLALYAATIVDGMASGTESLLHCRYVEESVPAWLIGVFPKRQKLLWIGYSADDELLKQSVAVIELPDVDYYAIPLDGRFKPDSPFSTKDIGANYIPGERSQLTLTVSLLPFVDRYAFTSQYEIDRMTGLGKSIGDRDIQCERADPAVAKSQITDFVVQSVNRVAATVGAFTARSAEVLARRKF